MTKFSQILRLSCCLMAAVFLSGFLVGWWIWGGMFGAISTGLLLCIWIILLVWIWLSDECKRLCRKWVQRFISVISALRKKEIADSPVDYYLEQVDRLCSREAEVDKLAKIINYVGGYYSGGKRIHKTFFKYSCVFCEQGSRLELCRGDYEFYPFHSECLVIDLPDTEKKLQKEIVATLSLLEAEKHKTEQQKRERKEAVEVQLMQERQAKAEIREKTVILQKIRT